jgi:hypothetical protein
MFYNVYRQTMFEKVAPKFEFVCVEEADNVFDIYGKHGHRAAVVPLNEEMQELSVEECLALHKQQFPHSGQ